MNLHKAVFGPPFFSFGFRFSGKGMAYPGGVGERIVRLVEVAQVPATGTVWDFLQAENFG